MDFVLFSDLVQKLENEACRLKKSYENIDIEQEYNFIDTTKFIKVLYTLFDINGLLLNSDRTDGIDAGISIGDKLLPNRFIFTEEYPDERANNRDFITFETVKRKPASLGSNEEPFSGTRQYRAMYRGTVKNKIDGCQEIHMMLMMDNLIRFTCWSTKVGQANKLARFLEQFITKYNWFLRRFVPVIVYQGQSIDSKASYGSLRYYPIHLDYFIRTAEIYCLSENEVRNIEMNINDIRTIINLEE